MKAIAKTLILIAFSTIPATSVLGWSQKGHDTVAYIAENHLTPVTQKTVDSLLDGKSMVYWANWLDNASHTDEYAYTKTWHYKNIDDGQTFEQAPLLPEGDIVRAINDQVSILKNPKADREQKALALKMVCHFLGDIHQPMHLGHASDRGGNQWHVKFFRKNTNLHSVWDSDLPEAAHRWSYSEWQQQIDRANPEEITDILHDSHPENWASETFEIAKKVYAETPEESNISYDYIANWTPVVEQQFLRSGIRLADLLNSIFDPEYSRTEVSR